MQARRCIHGQLRLMAEVIQACKQKCSEGCLINIQSTFNKKISVASSLMASPSSGFCSDSKYQMYFLSYILCLRSNRLGYMQNNHSIIVSFNTPCLSWWYYSTHGPWDPSIFDNNFSLVTCMVLSGTMNISQ